VTKATYIHGTDPAEQRRLVQLNRITNAAFVGFLDVQPGSRVLEVGSGLGILADEVAASAGGCDVVGIELSAAQIAAATRSARVAVVRADAHELPLASESFDLVYARFLLEHVANPAGVLGEMRRVLRRGGRVAVLENDVSLVRFDPPCPVFERVWAAFVEVQRALGGDALIGRRLFGLLRSAGFRDVELSLQPEAHWHGSPAWTPWVTNIIGNVESARRALIDSGRCDAETVHAALAELAALVSRPDASGTFVWNRARASN